MQNELKEVLPHILPDYVNQLVSSILQGVVYIENEIKFGDEHACFVERLKELTEKSDENLLDKVGGEWYEIGRMPSSVVEPAELTSIAVLVQPSALHTDCHTVPLKQTLSKVRLMQERLQETIQQMSPAEQLAFVHSVHTLNVALMDYHSLEQLQQSSEVAKLAALVLGMGQPQSPGYEYLLSHDFFSSFVNALATTLDTRGIQFPHQPHVMEALQALAKSGRESRNPQYNVTVPTTSPEAEALVYEDYENVDEKGEYSIDPSKQSVFIGNTKSEPTITPLHSAVAALYSIGKQESSDDQIYRMLVGEPKDRYKGSGVGSAFNGKYVSLDMSTELEIHTHAVSIAEKNITDPLCNMGCGADLKDGLRVGEKSVLCKFKPQKNSTEKAQSPSSSPPSPPTPPSWCWQRRLQGLSLVNIRYFLCNGSTSKVQELDTKCNETVCHAAVNMFPDERVLPFLRILESRKVDVFIHCDKDGNVPLHIAVSTGNIEAVKVLTEISCKAIQITNCEGATPIDLAFNSNQNGIFVYLLDQMLTAYPKCPDNIELLQSLLLRAMKKGRTEYLRILLKLQSQYEIAINFNCTDSDGHTAWVYVKKLSSLVHEEVKDLLDDSNLEPELKASIKAQFMTKVSGQDECTATSEDVLVVTTATLKYENSALTSGSHTSMVDSLDLATAYSSKKLKQRSEDKLLREQESVPQSLPLVSPSVLRTLYVYTTDDYSEDDDCHLQKMNHQRKKKERKKPRSFRRTVRTSFQFRPVGSGRSSSDQSTEPLLKPTLSMQKKLKKKVQRMRSMLRIEKYRRRTSEVESNKKKRRFKTGDNKTRAKQKGAGSLTRYEEMETDTVTPDDEDCLSESPHQGVHESNAICSIPCTLDTKSQQDSQLVVSTGMKLVDGKTRIKENWLGNEDSEPEHFSRVDDETVTATELSEWKGTIATFQKVRHYQNLTCRASSDLLHFRQLPKLEHIERLGQMMHQACSIYPSFVTKVCLPSQMKMIKGTSCSAVSPNTDMCTPKQFLSQMQDLVVDESKPEFPYRGLFNNTDLMVTVHCITEYEMLHDLQHMPAGINLLNCRVRVPQIQRNEEELQVEHQLCQQQRFTLTKYFLQCPSFLKLTLVCSLPYKSLNALRSLESYSCIRLTSQSGGLSGPLKDMSAQLQTMICYDEVADDKDVWLQYSPVHRRVVSKIKNEVNAASSQSEDALAVHNSQYCDSCSKFKFYINGKHFGHVVLYDFAGQHEYYSSHAPVMENLILPSPPLNWERCIQQLNQLLTKISVAKHLHLKLEMTEHLDRALIHAPSVHAHLSSDRAHMIKAFKLLLTMSLQEAISTDGPNQLTEYGEDLFMPSNFRQLRFLIWDLQLQYPLDLDHMLPLHTPRVNQNVVPPKKTQQVKSDESSPTTAAKPKAPNTDTYKQVTKCSDPTFRSWVEEFIREHGFENLKHAIPRNVHFLLGLTQWKGQYMSNQFKKVLSEILDMARHNRSAFPNYAICNLNSLSAMSRSAVRTPVRSSLKRGGNKAGVSKIPGNKTLKLKLKQQSSTDPGRLALANTNQPLEVIRSHLSTYSKCCPRHDIQNSVVICNTCPASAAFGPKRRYSAIKDLRDDTRHAPFNASSSFKGDYSTSGSMNHLSQQNHRVMSDKPMLAAVTRDKRAEPQIRQTAQHSLSTVEQREHKDRMRTSAELLHAQDYPRIFPIAYEGKPPHTLPPELQIPYIFITGLAYYKLSIHKKSVQYFQQCLQLAEECGRDGDVTICCIYIGDIEFAQRKYNEAAERYQKALRYYSRDSVAKDVRMILPTQSAVWSKCGSAFKNASKMADSITAYDQAIEQANSKKDKLAAHTSLGNLYQGIGENGRAVKEYEDAIQLAAELDDKVSLGWNHGNLGNALLGLYQGDKALHHLFKALDMAVEHETTPQAIGRAYNNLGTAYQAINDYSEAEKHYDLALAQVIYGNDIPGQARVYGNIGNLQMLKKKYDRAVPHYTEVRIPTFHEQATKSAVMMRLMNAKVIHLATHGSAVAGFLAFAGMAASLNQSVDAKQVLIYPEEIEKFSITPALVVLSSCDSGRGVFKADGIQGMARAFILAGAQAVLTTLWRVPDESACIFMQFFYQYLVDGVRGTEGLHKAMLSVRCFSKYSQYIAYDELNFTKAAEWVSHILKCTPILHDLKKQCTESDTGSRMFCYNIIRTSERENRDSSIFKTYVACIPYSSKYTCIESTVIVTNELEEFEQLTAKQENGPDLLNTTNSIKDHNENTCLEKMSITTSPHIQQVGMDKLVIQLDVCQPEHMHFLDFFDRLSSIIAHESICVCLYYTRGRVHGRLLSLNSSGPTLSNFKVPCSDNEYLGDVSNHFVYTHTVPSASEISDTIVRELQLLKISNSRPVKIVMMVNSQSNLIAYNLLAHCQNQVSDNFYFQGMLFPLCENILHLPLIFNIHLEKQSACIVGCPVTPPFEYNGNKYTHHSLPGCVEEANSVAHLLKCTPTCGEQATKATVMMGIGNTAIFHLATHAISGESILAFAREPYSLDDSDEFLLCPEEIEKLEVVPALVVLNSCNSGKGLFTAEGIARAFIRAGAQAVITTLDNIPDESACVFMQFFYQYLVDRMKGTEALHKAMLSVRCFSKYSQYIHWSSYQYMGREINICLHQSIELYTRLGHSSVFPQLNVVKQLEKALLSKLSNPTNVQVRTIRVHECIFTCHILSFSSVWSIPV